MDDDVFEAIDRPQSDRDRELAEHVLKGHRVGEIRRRREAGLASEEMQALEEPYTPHFNPEFLRSKNLPVPEWLASPAPLPKVPYQ